MTCAKQTVTARLVAVTREEFIGTNHCESPQKECPRDSEGYATGEGYHLCKSICKQGAHAEVNAIEAAGGKAKGATIYLSGHTYACASCLEKAHSAGVDSIIIK